VPGFGYNGGPVIQNPSVYASFWGELWSDATHQARAARLSQFLADLVASNFMNVLSQYGVGSGPGSGVFVQSSFVPGVTGNLTDADIASTIQSCISAGALPEPTADTALVVFLDETIGVDDPNFLGGGQNAIIMCEPNSDTAFGYHWTFTTTAGHAMYYSVIPSLSDDCITETCPDPTACSLNLGETQEQRLTQVTSHEFAEMCTDPQPFTGWVAEIGDVCNGENDTITVGANTWTVQRIYSLTDDTNSGGATICIAQAAAPEPKLAGGPASSVHRAMAHKRPGQFGQVLPLAPVYVDLKGKSVEYKNPDLRRFIHRVTHPAHYSHLPAGAAAALRKIADMIEVKQEAKK
jgi:hypothetical protein